MQPTRNTPNKKAKFLDTKIFIASLAVAVTVGFWNIFSNDAVQANKTTPASATAVPTQPSTNTGQDFPPLPTLVPLVDVQIPQPGAATTVDQPTASQTTQLRAVTVPTVTIVQNSKPVFDQGGVVVVVSGSGSRSASRSSSGSTGHTTTGSSHK